MLRSRHPVSNLRTRRMCWPSLRACPPAPARARGVTRRFSGVSHRVGARGSSVIGRITGGPIIGPRLSTSCGEPVRRSDVAEARRAPRAGAVEVCVVPLPPSADRRQNPHKLNTAVEHGLLPSRPRARKWGRARGAVHGAAWHLAKCLASTPDTSGSLAVCARQQARASNLPRCFDRSRRAMAPQRAVLTRSRTHGPPML